MKRTLIKYLPIFLTAGLFLSGCNNRIPSISDEDFEDDKHETEDDDYESIDDRIKEIYELAHKNGFNGTYEEWLDSIKGEKGEDGLNGKSAYEIYKDKYGYEGNESEWLDELVNGTLSNKKKHTVTFNTNGGNVVDSILVRHGEKITKPSDPVKLGYTFNNWTYKGENWSFIGYVCTEDMTLDANYIESVYKVNITTNDDSYGTVSITGTEPYKYGTALTLIAKPSNICLFDGRYSKVTDQLVSKENPYTFKIKENVDIYAKFSIDKTSKTFGTYPQTKVNETTEASLYQTLKNKVGEVPVTGNLNGWANITTLNSYINDIGIFYKDVYDGENKYRAVYYPDEDGYGIYYTDFFKFEPIIWNILSGNGLAVSKYVLDRCPFYTGYGNRTIDGKLIAPNNYEYSTLRKFLNNEFLDYAFTLEEQNSIPITLVDNSLKTTGDEVNKGVCNNTSDKIFPLSKADYKNPDYGFVSYQDKGTGATDYAIVLTICGGTTDCEYWSRTPWYDDAKRSVAVEREHFCGSTSSDQYIGIRPALKFNL